MRQNAFKESDGGEKRRCRDFMLVCLLIFTVYFTKNKFKELSRAALRLAALYAAFEVAVFTINPVCEVALGYVRGAGSADRENVQGPPGIQGAVPACDYRSIKATPLRWELRASADLLPQSCSMKNGKYIQYSHIFHTFTWVKIFRRISLPHYAVLP